MEVIGKMDAGHGTHELLLVAQPELHTLLLTPNPTLTLTLPRATPGHPSRTPHPNPSPKPNPNPDPNPNPRTPL